MPAENFYPETESAPAEPPAENTPPAPEAEEERAEGETALLPKALFPGEVNVGDSISLKVVKVYENEVEVSQAAEEPEGEEANQPMSESSPDMQAAEAAMENMAE